MQCRQCGHSLWNVASRQCPACGQGFRPSEYRFKPGSAAFLCPHCNARYVGMDEAGLIQPRRFACAQCNRSIYIDEMIVARSVGAAGPVASVAANPWAEHHRGHAWRRWRDTVATSLFHPTRLMQGTPENASALDAMVFLVLTMTIAHVVMTVLWGMGVIVFGPGIAHITDWLYSNVIRLTAEVGVVLIMSILWAGMIHVVLRSEGVQRSTWRRSLVVVTYAGGAIAWWALPMIGILLMPVSMIWWIVATIKMLRQGYRISAWQATIAVMLFPLLVVAAIVGRVYYMIVNTPSL
ncbi:MAG: hypothetical protein IT440_06935 [Phycisphaeraceae bacterium]|nr:hypothetical protein [Phycisphaeraceae bacterium]